MEEAASESYHHRRRRAREQEVVVWASDGDGEDAWILALPLACTVRLCVCVCGDGPGWAGDDDGEDAAMGGGGGKRSRRHRPRPRSTSALSLPVWSSVFACPARTYISGAGHGCMCGRSVAVLRDCSLGETEPPQDPAEETCRQLFGSAPDRSTRRPRAGCAAGCLRSPLAQRPDRLAPTLPTASDVCKHRAGPLARPPPQHTAVCSRAIGRAPRRNTSPTPRMLPAARGFRR